MRHVHRRPGYEFVVPTSQCASIVNPVNDEGHVVLYTTRFDDDVATLTDALGFRIEAIFPADAPRTTVVSGHGLHLRVERAHTDRPISLLLPSHVSQAAIRLPGGSEVTFHSERGDLSIPASEPNLVITRPGGPIGVGRAGMHYRDLLPDRWGGRFIASHITIPNGGPIPDYVHYHRVRFQLIFVAAGWVKVVYEDQGEPFVMKAGDCVLQPPEIRHRVLESSPGFEVIEIGSPALHETFADHDMDLPNGVVDPDHDFSGQRFVRHVAADAAYGPWHGDGWQARDTGIGAATDGLAEVHVARLQAEPVAVTLTEPDHEFSMLVVLAGEVTIVPQDTEPVRLVRTASVAIPPGNRCALHEPTPDCEILEVTLPAGADR